jgi:transposase
MVREHRGEHASQWAAMVSIAAKIGCTASTLNEWVKKSDVDSGRKAGVTYFAQAELDRRRAESTPPA